MHQKLRELRFQMEIMIQVVDSMLAALNLSPPPSEASSSGSSSYASEAEDDVVDLPSPPSLVRQNGQYYAPIEIDGEEDSRLIIPSRIFNADGTITYKKQLSE